MKRLLSFIPVLVTIILVSFASIISAQSVTDTVYIPGSSSLEISNIINADTSVTSNRVYVLDRGAIYYIEKAFEITHSCEFIATGDAERPPVLAPAIRADDSAEEWFFKLIKADIQVKLNDLYLLSMRSDGKTLGWSRAIHIGYDNISLKMRNVVIDGFSEVGIKVEGAKFVKLDVQDCHFRNMQHSTSYFGGQAFLSGSTDDADTTIFVNNTFFACNAYLFSIRGYDRFTLFEHNTIAYSVVNPFLINRAQNLHMRNNLFYATHAWGGDPEQVIGGWMDSFPDTASSGIINLWRKGSYLGIDLTGPERNDEPDLGIVFEPSQRVDIIKNNVRYNPVELVDFYNTWNDTVTVYDSVEVWSGPKQYLRRTLTPSRWINETGYQTLDSLTNPNQWDYSPSVYVEDAIDADPVFTDAGTVGHVSELIGYVHRIASRTLDNPWHYEINFPPTWPLPENLTYSNSDLLHAGTDGLAIGDLNWFPEQKAGWTINAVEQVDSELPAEYQLSQNYPNPFNPTTTINFSVSQSEKISLKVYNILGQLVNTLVDGEFAAGNYKVNFDANSLSSGMYFYTLQAGDYTATKKMILLK